MGLLQRNLDSSHARSERFDAVGGFSIAERTIENRDLALAFLLGVFALAGAAALTIILT